MSEKSIAGKDGGFGTGVPKGVAAPESGNNAAAGGALVPMLTLGVPGSGTTAVLLALLTTLNITPGPTLFTDRPEVVWGNSECAALDSAAGGHHDLFRGYLFDFEQLFRSFANGRLRCVGVCAAKTRCSDRAGYSGYSAGR